MTDKQQPASELRPCPWCPPEESTPMPKEKEVNRHVTYGPIVMHWIECDECNCRGPYEQSAALAVSAWNTRADLLQRVPDEKRLADIKRARELGILPWSHLSNPTHRFEVARDTIDYLLSLLHQPPAASERCGECYHNWIDKDGFCLVEKCGHRCVSPATGALNQSRRKVDVQPNVDWLKANAQNFGGEWVAIRNGVLLDVDKSHSALLKRIGPTKGTDILVIWACDPTTTPPVDTKDCPGCIAGLGRCLIHETKPSADTSAAAPPVEMWQDTYDPEAFDEFLRTDPSAQYAMRQQWAKGMEAEMSKDGLLEALKKVGCSAEYPDCSTSGIMNGSQWVCANHAVSTRLWREMVMQRTTTPGDATREVVNEIVKAWLWHTPEHDQDRARVDIERRLTAHFPPPAPAADAYVAFCRYVDDGNRIVLCDSDAKGAFKVYRAPVESARHYHCSCGAALTAEEYIEHHFEKGHDRGIGSAPAPAGVESGSAWLLPQIKQRLQTVLDCEGGMCTHCIDILAADLAPMIDRAIELCATPAPAESGTDQ